MFKILAEQYAMNAVPQEQTGAGSGIEVLEFACVAGLPMNTPQGPQMIPIPTLVFQVALDARERASLRAILDAWDAPAEPVGAPQPIGVESVRCGRLQKHPSHTWTRDDFHGVEVVWCDGGSALTDIGAESEPTDELPDPTPAG